MYINSFCSITPAGTRSSNSAATEPARLDTNRASCAEPDYKDLIPPMQLRRMTKPVRTGVAAAKICLQEAGVTQPDAIHTGTAFGMLQDSENFLKKMIEQEEQALSPTAFIQSTHNTVAGQIALALGCNAHNMTYVHKGHSFESALLDAALMLETQPDYQVLTGAVDECTDTSYDLLHRFHVFADGQAAGEGAAFFLVSQKAQPHSLARIRAFDMFVAPDEATAEVQLQTFFDKQDLHPVTTDLLLDGAGPTAGAITGNWFKANTTLPYKTWCGEYPTASAFALGLATQYITAGQERCWILNRTGRYWSIWCIDKIKPAAL